MTRRTRTIVSLTVSLLAALAVLAVLVGVVGVDAILDALGAASRGGVVAAFAVALCWMTAWSYSLFVAFDAFGVQATRTRSFLCFLVVLFVNGVAPFSVGGAEPIAAAFVSRYTGATYDRALLSVLSTSAVNYVPAPVLGVLGVSYLALTNALHDDVAGVAASLVAIVVAGAVLVTVGWRHRRSLEHTAVSVLVGLQRATSALVPDRLLPTPPRIRRRVSSFVAELERVTADRRVVAFGLASSTLGWFLQAGVLWTSLLAVDARIPYVLAVGVATVVAVVDVVPVPGGLGTVDATLVVLLVVIADVPSATAAAGAFVYRSAILAFPIVLGAASLGVLHTNRTGRR
jgi:hypothetical protein